MQIGNYKQYLAAKKLFNYKRWYIKPFEWLVILLMIALNLWNAVNL